jgi:uncharacterized membrane protein SirB2
MNLYTVSLFVHMIGLISMFGALVMLQHGGRRLRASTTWQEAGTWSALLSPVPSMFLAGGVFLLASGLYMTHEQWTYSTPWVVVAMVSVVLFLILGAVLMAPRFARIRKTASELRGAMSEDGRAQVTAPALWSTIFAMNGGALGIVWLMSTKPGWAGSIGIPIALMVVGALMGVGVKRPRTSGAVDRWSPRPARGGPLPHGPRSR